MIDPRLIRWIGFSHFEVDECGALNEWLAIAPNAKAVCSELGALVNMSDFAIRPALAMKSNEILNTGRRTLPIYPVLRIYHMAGTWGLC